MIVNQGGFYDPFVSMMQRTVDEQFMHDAHLEMWQVVDSVAEVPRALDEAPEWSTRAVEFASP